MRLLPMYEEILIKLSYYHHLELVFSTIRFFIEDGKYPVILCFPYTLFPIEEV